MVKLTLYLVLLSPLIDGLVSFKCPSGISGTARPPKPLIAIDGNPVAYEAQVEMVEVGSEGRGVYVFDSFDGTTGSLNIYANHGRMYEAFYNPNSDEGFIIFKGACSTVDLIPNARHIADLWAKFDFSPIFNSTKLLGPVGILWYISANSGEMKILVPPIEEKQPNDDSVVHWFLCLPEVETVIFMDENLGTNTTKIRLTHPNKEYTLNLVTVSAKNRPRKLLIAYPQGYGCRRRAKPPILPSKFTELKYFRLKTDVALRFEESSVTISMDISRYDSLYYYQLWDDIELIKSIHNSYLSIDYAFDPSTGVCSASKSTDESKLIKWPYGDRLGLNLSPSIFAIEDNSTYLGQTEEGNQLIYIFEKQTFSVFTASSKPAVMTYYFHLDPKLKVLILNRVKVSPKESILSPKGEKLSTVDIHHFQVVEGTYYWPRFDIQSCNNQQGSPSTWFQLVFSIVPENILKQEDKKSIFGSDLIEALSFIPISRLPDFRVVNYGPSIYITIKLLESPQLDLIYGTYESTDLDNPTSILVRNHDADCAQLCSNNIHCSAFSYCSDRQCKLFVDSEGVPSPQGAQPGCKLFTIGDRRDNRTEYQLASSSRLLYKIKSLIEVGELVLPSLNLRADEMFIVSGPDEIGDYGNAYESADASNSQLDSFKVRLFKRFLTEGERSFKGISYTDCLQLCQNDAQCSSLSYCDDNNECTISTTLGILIKANPENYTNYSLSCVVAAKSYLDSFIPVPGRSLVLSALLTLEVRDKEECAKSCRNEDSFDCEGFDLCSTSSRQLFCYLHRYHLSEEVDTNMTKWDSSGSTCSHFARKLSMDYKQFFGMKLVSDLDMIATITHNSLESCAAACDAAEKECNSFDYCESQDAFGSFIGTCRLTGSSIISSSEYIQTTREFCSAYGITREEVYFLRKGTSVPLAVICGILGFAFGILVGLVAYSLFFKRRCHPLS